MIIINKYLKIHTTCSNLVPINNSTHAIANFFEDRPNLYISNNYVFF